MSHDPADLLADATADLLTALDASYEFQAVVPEDPSTQIDVEGVDEPAKKLEVFVVPVADAAIRNDGAAVDERISINVFVSRAVSKEHTRRRLAGLVRELREALRLVAFDLSSDGFGTWEWDSEEVVAKYDAEQLTTRKRFLSIFSITYYNTL